MVIQIPIIIFLISILSDFNSNLKRRVAKVLRLGKVNTRQENHHSWIDSLGFQKSAIIFGLNFGLQSLAKAEKTAAWACIKNWAVPRNVG
jgi:hypothetical protein